MEVCDGATSRIYVDGVRRNYFNILCITLKCDKSDYLQEGE